MTKDRFKKRLQEIFGSDYSHASFARRLRVDYRTVTRWHDPDGSPVPDWVDAFLGEIEAGHALRKENVDLRIELADAE